MKGKEHFMSVDIDFLQGNIRKLDSYGIPRRKLNSEDYLERKFSNALKMHNIFDVITEIYFEY